MELEHFILEKYDSNNYYHKSAVILLDNDDAAWKYLGYIDIMIEEIKNKSLKNPYDNFFIAYQKGNIEPIGIIAISYFKNDNRYEIIEGLLPKYRGLKLASPLLKEFCEFLFSKYSEINELSVQINKSNIYSIKSALKAGFEKEKGTRYVKVRNYNKNQK